MLVGLREGGLGSADGSLTEGIGSSVGGFGFGARLSRSGLLWSVVASVGG